MQPTRPTASRSSAPAQATLILLCAVSVLPLSLFLPSLPAIARDLQADYALVGLSLGGYAALAASLELVMGPLSDRFGRRPIVLTSVGVFTLGSLGCALATDIRVFLACRLMQAAITSVYPVSMATIRDAGGGSRAASRIGYAAMAAAFAPMIGPTLGGLLEQTAGWRASFWLLAAIGVALFGWCAFDLAETHTRRSSTLARQFRAYPPLFRARRFWAYALCMAFSTGSFYAFLAGAPLAAQTLFAIPPAELGFYMGTITTGFVCGSFLTARLARRYPPTATILCGRLVACAGPLIAVGLMFGGATHAIAWFGPCVLVGIGNGLTNPGAHAGALSVRPELAGSASGLAGAMMIAGGAALSSLTGALLTTRNAGYAPLAMMLLSAALALLAALYVRALDARDGERAAAALD
ncbi:MFS transporter [Burkholderia pseudomultivorans]|uniref:Bicyclomycin resistance protein n=1 Tax=Burkholderia pseudomultivorans TaxID=1207504 RepID=A0A6P2INP4_9BURK|nr:MFS transporter [Burkholderia pseudomultivorans]MDR8726374.1 Bicyclomycin resistance protein [Burkholderia pseudomultivorans]MDR8733598.1 Bicyclomycin resistance protein [Burkholderia pseudomultivorans]MDR8740124.1 Bicyclomycin resistance protein [Burkholderia pseudomultivorans]MDR8752208.1 Bicyclomycin resistance protein [Burkholderia pseudomultivorans]MDR8776603.1 Bicyclomycin resistance protein [Burkholderia pseudomultivorans]